MYRKKMITRCLPLVVLTIASAGAFAQNQLGDGRALDSNLQAGAGGRNSPLLVNTAGRYANALVTGNVSGLGAFHGNVGYGAENAFRGSLGSDSQYNFNRISGPGNPIYAAPGSSGMLNAIANPLYGAGDIVLRNSTGYSAGEITGQYTPYGPANSLTNPNARYTANYGQPRTITFDQAQAYSAQPLAIGTDANGQQMAVNASPLTGLTIQHSDMSQVARFGGQLDPAASTGIDNQRLDTNPATRLRPGQAAPLPDDADNADSATFRRADSGAAPGAAASPLRLATGERLGRQMTQPAISASVAGVDAPGEGVSGFNQSLDKLLGSSTAKPGDDVYLDLLHRIRESSEKQLAPDNRLVPAPEDKAKPSIPTTTAPKPDLSESLPGAGGSEGPGSSAPGSSQPGQTPDRPIDRIVKKLDYDLPAMTSFAGSAQTLYNEAMAEAERYMRAERYFDAQGVYNRAALLQPDKPLAYVGMINAELGAGLFVPAANALRNLFNAHPEMIAARYAQPLLPPDKRMTDVRAKLTAYLKADTRSTDGPLNLAYLAYQQQDAQALQSALDIWAQRDPHDPLLPLLRRIWLSADSAPSSTHQP